MFKLYGFRLEIQVNYFFMEMQRLDYHMDENNLEKLDNELHVKVKKCLKQKRPCVNYFPNLSQGVRY